MRRWHLSKDIVNGAKAMITRFETFDSALISDEELEPETEPDTVVFCPIDCSDDVPRWVAALFDFEKKTVWLYDPQERRENLELEEQLLEDTFFPLTPTTAWVQRTFRGLVQHNSYNCGLLSPRRRHHSSNPERFESQDSLAASLDQSVAELRASKRINQTQELFESELDETNAMVERLRADQQRTALMYFSYFNFSALQIQRLYRGYRGRRVYRQSLAVKAALCIQRSFRAMRRRREERLKKFRILCRKILRGMRGIRAKEELSHKELLNRVNHNMMIETQWRKAMGVSDTESSLLTALYRKKFMRKRIGAFFRQLFWVHSVVCYWRSLVPEPELPVTGDGEAEKEAEPLAETSGALKAINHDDDDALKLLMWNEQKLAFATAAAKKSAGPGRSKPVGSPKKALSREELRRKQQAYTQRVQEENARHEAARLATLERQKEAARLAELEKKRLDDEHRLLRMAHASALREDLERRGLLAIKEFQLKKDEEARREAGAKARLVDAQHRIAAEVLSDETQQLLKRKQRSAPRL
ncbi:hypothetical protein PybrP1_002091 [[Pythium] brassicae (nom. inval.)]|nr:hypothetical protein PybrP1_002091 [[Pythium] brassicae (nom. inval.)]